MAGIDLKMTSHQNASPGQFAISVEAVTKVYRTYGRPWHRLAEIVTGNSDKFARETLALDNVSFSLARGDRLGIVGGNGSGKSTLLKLICGVSFPTKGRLLVNGRVSAMLELGAGFLGDLTGYANIEQFAMLRGLDPDQIGRLVPDVAAFSELGDFLNQPVRTYSSGMAMRLGFACAAYTEPEILIIDEALSVGDAYFQNKCLQKIKAMLDNGVTFVYVTHGPDAVRALCTRGLWLDNGIVRQFGSASEVGASYQSAMFARIVRANGASGSELGPPSVGVDSTEVEQTRWAAFQERIAQLRQGSGEIRIVDVSLLDKEGEVTDRIEFQENLALKVWFIIHKDPPADCSIAVGVTDTQGREIVHFSTAFKGIELAALQRGVVHCIDFRCDVPLCPGEYGIIGGVAPLIPHPQHSGLTLTTEVVDYVAGGARFSVCAPSDGQPRDLWGVVHIPYSVELNVSGEASRRDA